LAKIRRSFSEGGLPYNYARPPEHKKLWRTPSAFASVVSVRTSTLRLAAVSRYLFIPIKIGMVFGLSSQWDNLCPTERLPGLLGQSYFSNSKTFVKFLKFVKL